MLRWDTHKSTDFCCVVLYWVLKIHCVSILNIFLIYFKTSKLIIINVLWKHNRGTTQQIPAENSNSNWTIKRTIW